MPTQIPKKQRKTDFTTKNWINFRFLPFVLGRNVKFHQIWQKFTFLHICCVEKLKFLFMWRNSMYWNLKFLHMADFFSTYIHVGDRGDKYEVCTLYIFISNKLRRTLTSNHSSYWCCLHKPCFALWLKLTNVSFMFLQCFAIAVLFF